MMEKESPLAREKIGYKGEVKRETVEDRDNGMTIKEDMDDRMSIGKWWMN